MRGRIGHRLLPKIAEDAAALWLKEEPIRRVQAEGAERERREAEMRMAEYAKEDAQGVLADPFSTADAITNARRVEPHWQPTPEARRQAFDRRVTNALHGYERGSPSFRQECAALLQRASELDPNRLTELRVQHKAFKSLP
jgi:hypothetical protein